MQARLEPEFLEGARRELARDSAPDGWLLYELEGGNPIVSQILTLEDGLSRRSFVLVVADGPPRALCHRIERGSWAEWEGPVESYVGWREMEERLADLLEGCERVAMEVSERDAVPFVDHVPAGVRDLVASLGVEVVSSADLISGTCARWGGRGRKLHDRASEVLARIARGAFRRCSRAVEAGEPPSEHEVTEWIRGRCTEAGLAEEDAIVAFGPNSADAHYHPPAGRSRTAREGDVVLVDLWGRVGGEPRAVFADQTWMGVLAPEAGGRFLEAWRAVREARDATVDFIAERATGGRAPSGAEADRVAREVLEAHGFVDGIQHRTGHGMDRALHGFGPNLDSVETRDARALVPGVGFSVEPGLYFDGEFGVRSEINVYMAEGGPVVTTPDVQDAPWTA